MTTRNPLTFIIGCSVTLFAMLLFLGYCFAGPQGVALVFGCICLCAMLTIILAVGCMAHSDAEKQSWRDDTGEDL